MGWDIAASEQKKRNEQKASRGKIFGNNDDLYLSIKGKSRFTVRFVSELKTVNVLYHFGKKYIVPDDYIERMKALGFDVKTQYVCNVIDRDDDELRLKLLEKGPKVYGPVITRYNEVLDDDDKPIHPGGNRGDDWRIVVTVPQDPRNTTYEVSNLKSTPFTKAEKEMISRYKDPEKYKDLPIGERGLINIDEIYDASRYVERLDALILEKEKESGASEDLPKIQNSSNFKKADKKSSDDVIDLDDDNDDVELDDDDILF